MDLLAAVYTRNRELKLDSCGKCMSGGVGVGDLLICRFATLFSRLVAPGIWVAAPSPIPAPARRKVVGEGVGRGFLERTPFG